MPDMTAQATGLRTGNHRLLAYMSYIPQDEISVCEGSVNGTPTFPAESITVDNITAGSVAACLEGMSIEFFASGVSKGKIRVATGGGSGSTIQVAETSAADCNIANNDTFVVRADMGIFDRLVAANATFDKDSRTSYSDQGSNPPPVANAGGLWAGFLDNDQVYATATFDAADSFVLDPDSGGTTTYVWDVDDGTITVGSTTTEAITVQFPAGYRRVTLTVTDASNSKSTVRYIPVWVHSRDADSSDYPKSVLIESRSYPPNAEGWSIQFQLPTGSEASLDNLPDGALVVVWEDNSQTHLGSNVANRSHIKGVFYLDRDETEIDAEGDSTTFTAIGPLGVLAKTGALPQLMISDATPTNWQEIKSLTINRTLWYLWYWHTTVFLYFDFIVPAVGALAYDRLAASNIQSVLAQFQDIASSLGLEVKADWLGRLLVDRNPQLEDSSARSSRTTAFDLTTADMVRLVVPRDHHRTVKTTIFEAITDTAATVYSRSGDAPGAGTVTETVQRVIADDQADCNERCGLYHAWKNGLYNGRSVPRGVQLVVRGNYDILDPALSEWVTLTLPASTNKRGLNFTSSTRWLVLAADVIYDAELGAKEVTYTLDHETFGPDGVTEIRPSAEDTELPPWEPPPFGWGLPLPVGDPIAGGSTPTIAIIYTGGVALTSTFTTPEAAGGPTWTKITSATLGITGSIHDAVVDPYSPKYLGTGTAVNAWLVTSDEIGRLTDIFGSIAYAVQDTFVTTTALQRSIEATRGVPNLVAVASYYGSTAGHTGTWVNRTTNGSTWLGEVQVSSHYANNVTFSPDIRVGIYVGRAGIIYVDAMTATDITPAAQGHKSTDSGASFAAFSNPNVAGFALPGWLHFPWHNNSLETLAYFGSQEHVGGGVYTHILYKANGTTRTDITPADSSARKYITRFLRSIATPDNNNQRIVLAGTNETSAIVRNALFISDDGGTSWVQVTTEVAATAYTGVHVAESGLVYAWGSNLLGVAQFNDLLAGGGFDSRFGDLGAADIRNIMGG